MNPNFQWHEGADALSLAEHLAGEIAIKTNDAILDKGSAVIALSGGSTPKPMFEALAQHHIDWSKVILTLVDERWVDQNHELSNSAFLKTYLIDHIEGTKPAFVSLYSPANDVESSCDNVLDAYCQSTNSTKESLREFDVVVLGMGGDGHTASFFPDAPNIAELVDAKLNEPLLTCSSATTQVPRITWSVPMLLNTGFLALHFTGDTKAAVFQQAATGGESTELPIRSVIFQDKTELNVFYAD